MIKLTLPYPVSANRYWAHRIINVHGRPMPSVYVTSEAKAFKDAVRWRAVEAGVRKPLAGRLAMHLQLFPHRPQDYKTRMRKLGEHWDNSVQCIDLGNAEKVISDALQGVVIEDDKWFWRHTKERMEPDELGARAVIVIATIDPAHAERPLF